MFAVRTHKRDWETSTNVLSVLENAAASVGYYENGIPNLDQPLSWKCYHSLEETFPEDWV